MLSDENKLRIFSGNANPDLAREIAAYLGTTVGDAVINRFNNGEVQVMINESVRGKDIFIVQPTCGKQPCGYAVCSLPGIPDGYQYAFLPVRPFDVEAGGIFGSIKQQVEIIEF